MAGRVDLRLLALLLLIPVVDHHVLDLQIRTEAGTPYAPNTRRAPPPQVCGFKNLDLFINSML
jgi:hypothetical protein